MIPTGRDTTRFYNQQIGNSVEVKRCKSGQNRKSIYTSLEILVFEKVLLPQDIKSRHQRCL